MADYLQSFSSHIKNVCGLQVAVRCTVDADEICRKNYLNFCEILRPFSQLTTEIQLTDVTGHLYSIRDLRIRFSEPHPDATPKSTVDQLLVKTIRWSERGGVDFKPTGSTLKINNIEISGTCPWFEHYRECYHDNVQILEHEYFRHYLAVVSTRTSKPIEAFQNLYHKQKDCEKESYPFWLSPPHIYYYHVLLHDICEGDNQHAKESFDKLKSIYGSGNCYFLPINSINPVLLPNTTVPEPWSGFLRIPSTPLEQEENDLVLKRFRRSSPSQTPSSQTPPLNSRDDHTHSNNHNSRAPPTAVIEGEVKVMLEASSSSTSIEVELGDEPLASEESDVSLANEARRVRLGECLALTDQNNLRNFVREFSQKLLPHLAAVLKKLNDQLQSKRTMGRRVSSFSRGLVWKMIGGSGGAGSSNSTSSISSKNSEDSILGTDSVERLMRLVGDVAFLLQNYELSYNMHHTLKRDLQGKDFWIHYAGALEMAALSAQLLGQTRKEVQLYLEEASQIYQKTLLLPDFALRSSMLLCDILKERQKFRELSQQFIKMINEESELHSALCLEQAAHSFLRVSPPMIRKYAFHLILAGHHFSRANLKCHSVRAYKQSLDVYQHKGWTVAEDYTNFSCARLCFSLQSLEKAHQSLDNLLSHENYQNPQQQMSNLRDYIYVKRMLFGNNDTIPLTSPYYSTTNFTSLNKISHLPLPTIKPQLILTTFDTGHTSDTTPVAIVTVGGAGYDPAGTRLSETAWQTLERSFIRKDSDIAVLYMNSITDNTRVPFCPINEPVKVGVVLKNPLGIPLLMRNVSLTWNFTPSSNEDVNNEAVSCQVLEKFILQPRAQEMVHLNLIPHVEGSITITGIVLNLCDHQDDIIINDVKSGNALHDEGFQGRLDFHCKGLRRNYSKLDRLGVVYGEDNRLCWKVVQSMPRIIINIEGFVYPLFAGQVVKLSISIINCSSLPVTNIRMNSSLQHCMLLEQGITSSSHSTNWDDNTIIQSVIPITKENTTLLKYIPLYTDVLSANESYQCSLLLHVPSHVKSDQLPLDMSFYYEPAHKNDCNQMKYRILRHSELLKIQASLQSNITVAHSMYSTDKFDLMVTMEIENCSGSIGKLLNFRIIQLTSISYSWKLQHVMDRQNEVHLAPGEVGVIYIKAYRELNISDGQLLISDVPLGNKTIRSDTFPEKQFILYSESCQQLINNSVESKIMFFIHWEAYTTDSNIVYRGHHDVNVSLPHTTSVLNIPHSTYSSPPRPLFTSPSPYDLVRHALFYPSTVSHDFSTNRICTIPVRITLINTTSQLVDVVLELLATSEVAVGVRSLEPSFHWSGPSKTNVTLHSLSTETVLVYASCLHTGVYCLNSLRVKARLSSQGNSSHGNMHHQRWQVPSYLTVSNTLMGGAIS